MKRYILVILSFFILVANAPARDFNYSHFSVRYVDAELDDGTSGSGVEYDLAYDFNRLVFSLHVVTLDYGSGDASISRDTHVGGVGSYLDISESFHLYGSYQAGVYNSDGKEVKLAERDVSIFKFGAKFKFSELNEGDIYFGRYFFSENQVEGGGPAIEEDVIGFRASIYMAEYPNFGVTAGVELFDSFRYTVFGLNLLF